MTIHEDTSMPSDEPLETDQTEQSEDSYVGECGVTICRFNKARIDATRAVSRSPLVDSMAHCATFDPTERTDLFDSNTAESI